jgi:hypothetical protein
MWVVTDEVGVRVYMNQGMARRDTEMEFYGGLDWIECPVNRINLMGWQLVATAKGHVMRRVACLWKVPAKIPKDMHPKMRKVDNYVRQLLQEKAIRLEIANDGD